MKRLLNIITAWVCGIVLGCALGLGTAFMTPTTPLELKSYRPCDGPNYPRTPRHGHFPAACTAPQIT